MKLLDIINTIFEYKHFETIIISVSIFLVVLFIIVLILGIKDAKKKDKTKKVIETPKEEIVTMEALKEELIINEEVTLEMPTITKNLEDFKKIIEEEIKQETTTSNVEVEKTKDKSLTDTTKPVKILNINEIEDTIILDTIEEPKVEKKEQMVEIETIEEELEEEPILDIKEEAIVEVQKLDIPLLAPDEDDELLFKTMTALRLPQDI